MSKDQEFTRFDFQRNISILPEGIHTFRIIDAKEAIGGSGFPYILFTLECHENAAWNEMRAWLTVSLSPAAKWKLDEFLNAVEAPEEGQGSAKDFLGQYIKARIVHEDYEAEDEYGQMVTKTRASVKSVLPANSSTESPQNPLDFKNLATKKKSSEKPANLPDDVIED